MIRGRQAEYVAVQRLLTRARGGDSGALVVRGEAGIGKTELLRHARATASGFRVVSTAGVESEIGFAFAGLHQLCAPLMDRLARLPEPQQAALTVAFGQRPGGAPDPFLVAVATLGLLAEAAEDEPLLCLVDDAHWLDLVSAQVFAFVARRVQAERLALVFGLRDQVPAFEAAKVFAGLTELRLDGLTDADARALLGSAVHAPLDDRVRERILAEARGNPLALLELSRHAAPAGLAGGFAMPDARSVPGRIEESFQRRAAGLPSPVQAMMLIAAADPVGDAALLWRAAERLGIDAEAIAPAEAAGLLEVGATVRFSHPLVRSAVYRAAEPAERRRAHGALAEATDERADPDRRAWHRARAVLGTDETIALELERSAGRARARGGLGAAAAFLERAAVLTPDPADRAYRALSAAQAQHEAGASDAAFELLTIAVAGPLDGLHRARAERLRAQIEFARTRSSDVPGMLLDSAKTLAPLDPAQSRDTYLQALEAAIHAGPLGHGRGVVEVAEAARDAPAPAGPPTPADLLLDGLVTRFTRGYEASVPGLRRALQAYRDHLGADDASRRGLWAACRAAYMLWDDETLYGLTTRFIRLARDAGALSTLATALNFHSTVLVQIGDLAQAAGLVADVAALSQSTGAPPLPHDIVLRAYVGRRAEAVELFHDMVQEATQRGEGTVVTLANSSMSVLYNGLSDYRAALRAASVTCDADELTHSSAALPELVEAAVRAGEPSRAAAALERLSSRARASGTPLALGVEARSRALTTTGPAAEDLYREAIGHLSRCRYTTFLGRAHLLYGEWLRREGRRQDARDQLRTAYEMLSDMGMEAFAGRAARELRAVGEQPRKRVTQPADALTPQELRIARLVAAGATSREAAAQLFLSPRTIDAHLRNIFGKLGIASRRELRSVRLS
ncbi:AAA family ATPase [Nonomuraea sp. NPDC049421]|uniref:ATP-binding protein n=1 Tax=Nonomuraea sp. NPDC049421 TaxID=3155275 RepID=UPI00341310B5